MARLHPQDREGSLRTWIRWITGLAGLLITGIGLTATWNVLAPGGELGIGSVEGWMFEGPALITFGVLLVWTASLRGPTGAPLEKRAPALLIQIGLGFLALPAATWAWWVASGTTASSYAWSFASFALGVPGVALLLTGVAVWGWRGLRERSGG